MTINRNGVITIAILTGLLLVVALVAWWVSRPPEQLSSETAAGQALQAGSDLENTPFRDLSGEPITLEQFEGSVLVVNSWASWCPFCMEELPQLATVARQYSDRDVVMLAINREESKEQAERFLNRFDADLSGITFVLDTQDIFYESIDGFTMPETVFFNRKGEKVVHERGDLTKEKVRQRINDVLTSNTEE